MDNIQTYTQITTAAVVLLVLSQLIFLIVTVTILSKVKKLVNNLQQTSNMGKAFMQSLREQQLKHVPLWKLGLFAFKRARSLRQH